jgi:hypothetical protein
MQCLPIGLIDIPREREIIDARYIARFGMILARVGARHATHSGEIEVRELGGTGLC